jgi:hypothetical protein
LFRGLVGSEMCIRDSNQIDPMDILWKGYIPIDFDIKSILNR